MIGVDTNVLVRAYLEDDKEQAKEAQEFLSKATQKTPFLFRLMPF
jgi:predicted nucleic-acid-binding protein